MFRSIFKRRGTTDRNRLRERRSSVAPASVADQADAARRDVPVDKAMAVISRELSGLARIEVGQAAKERGWAALSRELERRPVRPAGAAAKSASARSAARGGVGSQARTIRSANPRWVMISAAAVAIVALAVSLAAVYGGGGGGPVVVDNPPTTGTVTSVVGPDTSVPETTIPSDVTTVPIDETTVPTDGTTVTTSSPTTDGGTTPTSDSTATTGGTTVTTKAPPTTQPTQTTIPTEQAMAAAQREKDARNAAQMLGSEVLLAFQSGNDLGDVSSLVTSGAWADVTQMVSTLNNPDGCVVSTKSVNKGTVSILLTFNDLIPDGQGGQRDVSKSFIVTVRAGEDRAVITAISYAGSGS